MGEMENAYKILFGKSEGKRPFRRQRRRWEDTISKVNVNVTLPLYLTEHHAMKEYWGSECIAPRILNLGTR
jgi:hypothetical protein